jgi:hypothetical protein
MYCKKNLEYSPLYGKETVLEVKIDERFETK